MAKRVAVVTGSNKGIGFEVVKALCSKFDGDVYLTARDEGRGKAAVEALKKTGLDPKFHLLDIDKEASIKTFASFLKKEYNGVDVLVNNAAIAYKWQDPAPFSEQAEHTIKTNFFSTRTVCHHFFPLLKPHARVVTLSSSAGLLPRIPGDDQKQKLSSKTLTEDELCDIMNQFVADAKKGQHVEKGWGESAYVVSKVGVSALTFVQHRNFFQDSEEDLVINVVHPGYVDTDMTSHKGPLSPEQGAEPVVYLALLPPNVKSPRGEFIWTDKSITSWAK